VRLRIERCGGRVGRLVPSGFRLHRGIFQRSGAYIPGGVSVDPAQIPGGGVGDVPRPCPAAQPASSCRGPRQRQALGLARHSTAAYSEPCSRPAAGQAQVHAAGRSEPALDRYDRCNERVLRNGSWRQRKPLKFQGQWRCRPVRDGAKAPIDPVLSATYGHPARTIVALLCSNGSGIKGVRRAEAGSNRGRATVLTCSW
jgi:hypothetical protein